MTMHLAPSKDMLAARFEPESFRTYAWAELSDYTPWIEGVCFNPACSATFEKTRDWQVYCCTRCKQIAETEMRKWGHKMALPLLIHRMGKYADNGSAQKALVTTARRYVTHVQSEWLADRNFRIGGRADG